MEVDAEKVLAAAAIVAALATLITKAKAVYGWVGKSVKWIVDRVGLPSKVLRHLETQGAAIAAIQAELKPNGGQSIRDAIDDIRRRTIEADIRSRVVREILPTGMYECTPAGECVWVNEALCDLFGMHPEAMLGHGWLSAVLESDRDAAWQAWKRAIENITPYSDTYTVVNQRTGTRTRCWTKASRYIDAEGHTVMYYGTVKKIESFKGDSDDSSTGGA